MLVAKYADHLLLYCQSEIYARDGVALERSTLADWIGQSAALLRPLVGSSSFSRAVAISDAMAADHAAVITRSKPATHDSVIAV